MSFFPAFIDFRSRPVLLVGGGEQAARKLRLLLKSEAAVTLVAADAVAEIEGHAQAGTICWRREAFRPEHMDNVRFAIVAAEEPGLAEAAAVAARVRGVLINVVDRADLSDFTVPAIVERGDITIGIASHGAAPMLASRIRLQIEAMLPARLGDLAKLAGDFRFAVKRVLPDADSRRRFWRRVFDGPAAQQALAGDGAAARETMLRQLNGAQQAAEGVVHLVGAGPGDPDLLTIAAQQALLNADVIFHDDLVAPALLERARRDADRVPVGKRMGRHSMKQDDINALLLQAAREGKRVVRLKAGDPFVFGRGGEEADYLQAHGISVTVVPGITAALGCAAAAGIPLTHRDLSSSLTLVTGHNKPGSEAGELDWTQRVGPGHTVAVYMGLSQAESIRQRLLGRGVSPALPVALIENGSRPDQVVSVGALAELPAMALRHGDGPTLLIIGEVAAKARATEIPQNQRRIA
ncbi:siroheme synthase CysG [Ferrovibrio sp.]|uniref:siroheme synthase CysG n=1 Tax=Ferrovibrio sp. TaxID=1917215 RepID=UPI0025BC93E9|nr:siroheme synthase CysG [Ferrovibrio sp.]MBX3454891.1 siroheme synthase CysG [Ferrovibrio sp.]